MSRLYNQAKSLFRPKIKTGSLRDRRKDFEEIVKSTDKVMEGVKFSPEAKAEIKKGVSTTLKKTSKLRDDIDKIRGTDKEYKAAGGRIGYKKGTPSPFLRKSNRKKIEEAFKVDTPFMVKKDKPKKRLMAKKGSPDPKKKKKFPDLTGDGKVTFADILKGRGVINGKKKPKKKKII